MRNNSQSYSWWGNALNGSTIGIVSNSFGKFVEVYSNGKHFAYYPLSSRYNAQVELPPASVIDEEPEIETPSNITVTSCAPDDCSDIINILVLVTPEASDELTEKYQGLPSQQQALVKLLFLGLGEMTVNVALMNSGIVGKSARFVTESFENFDLQFPSDIIIDLNNFINSSEAIDRLVANRADMMVLLTDSRYGPYFGVADAFLPAAIVAVDYIGSPRYTFAHEIGHLLGAQHNRVSNGGDAADNTNCNFGYKFSAFGGLYTGYTIMARMTEIGASRILYYSNPAIFLGDTPIGASGSNNSNFISHTFCEKADLFEDDELSVNITGPTILQCNQSGTYTVQIDMPGNGIPGLPPYNFSWLLGESPFRHPGNSFMSLGHASSVTINSANVPFDNFWLLVWIVSSDGVMTTAVIDVENVPCSGKDYDLPAKGRIMSRPIIYPNPTTNILNIELDNSWAKTFQPTHYQIHDAIGNIVGRGIMETNHQELNLDLSTGIYSIFFQSGSSHYVTKFSFIK